MTTFLPLKIEGTRYASVLPVPVPASARSTRSLPSARSTASAMASWPARASYPGRPRARGPSGPSSSTAFTTNALCAVLVRRRPAPDHGRRDRAVGVQELHADDLPVRFVLRPDNPHL